MKVTLPSDWRISTTVTAAVRDFPGVRAGASAAQRLTFTTPPDPHWATYHAVASTARPSAVAFR